MISDAQLAWFVETVGSLPRVPTLAFYHIPLHEYEVAPSTSPEIARDRDEPRDSPSLTEIEAEICRDLPSSRLGGGRCEDARDRPRLP